MQTNFETAYQTIGITQIRYKVIRNTYGLLGLSMIPSVIGSIFGSHMDFSFLAARPIMSTLMILAVFYSLTFAIRNNRYSSTGVFLMLGLTFLMGLLLGPLLQQAFRFPNGGQLIMTAAGITSLIFVLMAGISSTTKRELSGLGNFLTVGAIVLMAAMLANIFLSITTLHLMISAAFALFSSLMILWQIKMVVNGGEDSYISAALSIYISIYNLFSSLLQLLLAFSGERD